MGEDADITEEWAQRIMCAVEGVPYESSKQHVSEIDYRDATKKEGASPGESIFWIGIGSWELGNRITYFGKSAY